MDYELLLQEDCLYLELSEDDATEIKEIPPDFWDEELILEADEVEAIIDPS